MAKQTSTRATAHVPRDEGSAALAEQVEETKVANEQPLSNRDARKDADDTARKQYAKRNGMNLFPEVKPEEGQIVLAYKSKAVGSTLFEAQYHSQSSTGADGAFYANRDGTFSFLVGAVDCWMEGPA